MKWFGKLQGRRQLPWGILGVLVGVAVLSSGWSIYRTGDWEGAALNFGTEMAGAVVTYLLLEIVLETRQRKETLIAQMGSMIRDVAVPAVDELRRQGWLEDGSLKGGHFSKANLEGANLDGANIQNARFELANLKEAILEFAGLEGAIFEISNLEGADLERAKLEGACFNRANLQRARLWSAHLQGAELIEANLVGADFRGANLKGAKLWVANLKDAKLGGANVEEADFIGAQYNRSTSWPECFDPEAAGAILVEDEEEEDTIE